MIHRHLLPGTESLTAIEDVLDRGSVDDWKRLADRIRREPNGPLAHRVALVLARTCIYGTTPLWTALLQLWGTIPPPPTAASEDTHAHESLA